MWTPLNTIAFEPGAMSWFDGSIFAEKHTVGLFWNRISFWTLSKRLATFSSKALTLFRSSTISVLFSSNCSFIEPFSPLHVVRSSWEFFSKSFVFFKSLSSLWGLVSCLQRFKCCRQFVNHFCLFFQASVPKRLFLDGYLRVHQLLDSNVQTAVRWSSCHLPRPSPVQRTRTVCSNPQPSFM